MASVATRLKELQREVGDVGADRLYAEAKKRKLPGISRETIRLYLSTDESKQIFRQLPPSKGKTASEQPMFRVQLDLIDERNNPARFRNQGPYFRAILVIVDVFSRFIWTAPLKNKEPATVAPVLRRLINDEMETLPAFAFSDKGNELQGQSTIFWNQ